MSPPRKERAFFLPHEGQAPYAPSYTGSFFGSGGGGGTSSDGTFRLSAAPEWDSVNGYTI